MTDTNDKHIQVMELFGPTIQGEGIMSGTVTHFLRTGGCPLYCTWCDSLFAVDPAMIKEHRKLMTPGEVIDAINGLSWAPYVTFTGGDPAIQKRLGDIIPAINANGTKVAVETQGMFFPDWFNNCDVLTFSPKGPTSGNIVPLQPLINFCVELGTRRKMKVCIKVVVFNEADFEYAMDMYSRLPESYYDAFYFTAGTPLYNEDLSPEENATERLVGILHTQAMLADLLLDKSRMIRFNEKVHIGCQQHVLLWPTEDKGV